MADTPEILNRTCPVTSIPYLECQPGGPGPAPAAVFFVNGIGLDREGFRGALDALARRPVLPPHSLHVALTAPGFEDELERLRAPILSMEEQARWLLAFLHDYLERNPAQEVILYGFSFGSDLLAELLGLLDPAALPLGRVLLAEANVHTASCFITSRITASYEAAASLDRGRHREAYSGFVRRVLDAYNRGQLSSKLMLDMTQYFHTISRKDWHQLAHSAREASHDPSARILHFLDRTARFPATRFEMIFSDLRDLRAFQKLLREHGGPFGDIRVVDRSAHEHFHHMDALGVLENLREIPPPGGAQAQG